MENYPETATERFDKANFHIKYCLTKVKKYILGDVLEIGAGCGSFTRNYITAPEIEKVILTEKDSINIKKLKENFENNQKISVTNKSIQNIDGYYDTILYFHVLEHIEDDIKEIEEAKLKLKPNGHLIIIVPAHQKMYGKLDKAIGHFRRYDKKFFKDFDQLNLLKLQFLDTMGYMLYFFNRIFFKKETFPSSIKIFIWDKIFTPFTIIIDFITNYNFGKCIIAIYKK